MEEMWIISHNRGLSAPRCFGRQGRERKLNGAHCAGVSGGGRSPCVPVCVLGLFGLIRWNERFCIRAIMCVFVMLWCWRCGHSYAEISMFLGELSPLFFPCLSDSESKGINFNPWLTQSEPLVVCVEQIHMSRSQCVCATVNHYINCLFVWLVFFFKEPDIKLPRFHDNLFLRHAVVF